jgi:hypothetical protein
MPVWERFIAGGVGVMILYTCGCGFIPFVSYLDVPANFLLHVLVRPTTEKASNNLGLVAHLLTGLEIGLVLVAIAHFQRRLRGPITTAAPPPPPPPAPPPPPPPG